MVEAAIAGNPAFRLSRVEVDRPGPSFAVDTLDAIAGAARAAGREPDLWWIMSAEAFADIRAWREPERFIASCRVALVPRPGAPRPTSAWAEGLLTGAGDRVVVVDGPELGVSSSLVRARAAAGRSIRYLVPDAVAAYIDAHISTWTQQGGRPTVTEPAAPDTPRTDGLPRREAPASPSPPMARRRSRWRASPSRRPRTRRRRTSSSSTSPRLTSLADYFVICSGGSERQLAAIAEAVVEKRRGGRVRRVRPQGSALSHWLLVDFGSVVVHMFAPPERDFYQLERLWSEAKTIVRVQ